MSCGPLHGMRVVDASAGAAGPWAGSLLGQLGADVIKIEPPPGDFIRNVLPTKGGLSTTYIAVNLNKRGMVLDMKQAADRAEAQQLVAGADIFLENFRPGVADRIGLGWTALSALNPRLVYVSASGFGWAGPLAPVGATDPHIQAFTGMTTLNGMPGSPRQRFRCYTHCDIATSVCMVQGALAALLERNRTGRGRWVQVTMVEAALALQRVRIAEYLGGDTPHAMGSATTYLAPDRMFRALDSWVAISVTSPAQWRGFCAAIGQPALADDARFADNRTRLAHRAELDALLDPVIAARPADYWVRTMARQHVPAARPTSFDDFRHHMHYRENGMLVDIPFPTGGDVTVGGTPWRFANHPDLAVRTGPLTGQHTAEIREHGWAAPAERSNRGA